MQSIQSLLKNKKIVATQSSRKINTVWEIADEFGKYCGLPTPFVLRLFKMFGQAKVLGIKSWLADCPYDEKKGGKIALAMWKLKNSTAK